MRTVAAGSTVLELREMEGAFGGAAAGTFTVRAPESAVPYVWELRKEMDALRVEEFFIPVTEYQPEEEGRYTMIALVHLLGEAFLITASAATVFPFRFRVASRL